MTSTTRSRIAALGLAAVVGAFHGFMKEPPSRPEVEKLTAAVQIASRWQGRFPADFRVRLLDGGEFSMAEAVGQRIVLLNFFATWCVPCRAEMPELMRFAHAHRGEPLAVLFIDAAEPRADVRRFAQELGLDAPIGIDDEKRIERRYGVDSYPTTVLVGPDGRIALYEAGQILNAEVSLEPLYRTARAQLAHGTRIARAAYLAALAQQPPPFGQPQEEEGPKLDERQRKIAAAMPCPCGCQDTVLRCGCQTAKKVARKLAGMPVGGKSDADIAANLNREFCVGASLARGD